MKIPIIHDGDHGSDDFVTTLMLLSRPDLFDLLGVTICHGNVGVDQAVINALKALHLTKQTDIPVFAGSRTPWKIPPKLGDNAFQGDGLGGVMFDEPDQSSQRLHAVEWIRQTLDSSSEAVTIVVTGPMTNIAVVLETASEKEKNNIAQIVAMGGGYDPDGNITDFAEFNFYMDPDAADYVLNSGVPVILHNLHSDHQMVFTPARQELMMAKLGEWTSKFSPLMRSAEHLDMRKFGSNGSYVHDEQTAIWLQNPALYECFYATARVNTDAASPEHGRLSFTESNERTPLRIVRNIIDIDQAFGLILENLATVLGRS